MISYTPFYRTLLKKNVTEYSLIFKHGVDAKTLHRMKHGENVTLKTVNLLCEVLNCDIGDIIEYKPDK